MDIDEEINKNKEIRNKILKTLYKDTQKNPRNYLKRGELEAKTGIDGNKLDQEVLFLRDKGYLEIITHSEVYFQATRITSLGREYVENQTFTVGD